MKKLRLFKLKAKLVLLTEIILVLMIIFINSIFLNTREVKADFDLKVKKGDTFIYKITDFEAEDLNSINFEFYSDPDKAEKICYEIYQIDKKSTTHNTDYYKIRYRIWGFTDDENDFFQGHDDLGEIHVFEYPPDYEPRSAYYTVKKMHNNSDVLMSIAMDDVKTYLKSIPWHINTTYVGQCTIVQSFGTHYIYYRYDSDKGFLREYMIILGGNVIFRALYWGSHKNPSENELFFELLPFLIATGATTGITIIICSIIKKVKK